MERLRPARVASAGALSILMVFLGSASSLLGTCGPFTDAAADGFCGFVLEIFYLGITTGTTPTTFDPAGNVSRLQMAAFLSRGVDSVLKRGGRRAALRQFWTPQYLSSFGGTGVGKSPLLAESDGADIWVPNGGDGTVSRVRGSDGALLRTYTGLTNPVGVAMAAQRVWVTGGSVPGKLYSIDPAAASSQAPLAMATLGNVPLQIAFDGANLWTANAGSPGSVSTYFLQSGGALTATAGFNGPNGVLFDGSNIWVTDTGAGTLLKLNSSGVILQTVTVGAAPEYPVFDGANIWVPNYLSDSVSVVRASSGVVLATLTGNSLHGPKTAAFDGQRILITDYLSVTVSFWKAADLEPIGNVSVTTLPGGVYGACSDGTNFWITIVGDGNSPGVLTRF